MFRWISQARNLGLIYRLLRLNRVAKPVLLNIINPIFSKINFSGLGGACPSHKAKLGKILTLLKKKIANKSVLFLQISNRPIEQPLCAELVN